MMRGLYKLDGKTPVLTESIIEWGKCMESPARRVALTQVGGARVSTVFLGLDHAFFGGPPLLFETMVFRGAESVDQVRYSTWEEAESGHQKAVSMLMDTEKKLSRMVSEALSEQGE